MRTIDRESIQNLFAGNIRKLLIEAGPDYEKLYEIRLRVGRPLFLVYAGGERFLQIKRIRKGEVENNAYFIIGSWSSPRK